MGLASVGYRDSTELVLQWWHSLGVSDCRVLDGIFKLFYISENKLRIKTPALSCRDWFPDFLLFQIFSHCRVWFYMNVLCVLDMHMCKLLYPIYYVCKMEGYFLKHLLQLHVTKWSLDSEQTESVNNTLPFVVKIPQFCVILDHHCWGCLS